MITVREYIWQQADTFSHLGVWHWRCDVPGCIVTGQSMFRVLAELHRDAHVLAWHSTDE